MGLTHGGGSVQRLIEYWTKQGLPITLGKIEKIEACERLFGVKLPFDFKEFYSIVNGMELLYPNDGDANGFLFYPIEAVVSAAVEFKNSNKENLNKVLLFCDYMQCSWWYGLEVIDNEKYTIGMIPDRNSFKPICNSLAEFIDLYMKDSELLYES